MPSTFLSSRGAAATLTVLVVSAGVPTSDLLLERATGEAGQAGAVRDAPGAHGRGVGRDIPLVFAHRGASGYVPEHTLPAYELAIEMGADYIEPDLVMSEDGHFVVRHENDISGTTDVADHPEFADRRTTKVVDGVEITGWFTEDFTLAELKTLRAVERLPELRPANTAYDGTAQVLTLEEVIELAQREGVGVFPEMKHPTYFAELGLPMPERLAQVLASYGLTDEDDAAMVQSFEPTALREVDEATDLRTVLALSSPTSVPPDYQAQGRTTTYGDLATPTGLRRISRFLDAIGPEKAYVIPRDADGALMEPTDLVRDAHRTGLEVYVYTMRRENAFLPTDLRRGDPESPAYLAATGDAAEEYERFYEADVDGVWSDNTDLAVATRHEVFQDTPPDEPKA